MSFYVDGFILPVKKSRLEEYKTLAQKAGEIWRELGALEYVDCIAEDVPQGKLTSFPLAVHLEADEVVFFSWIKYASRLERDRINTAVMNDPRMKHDLDQLPFDGKRLIFGGFVPFVTI